MAHDSSRGYRLVTRHCATQGAISEERDAVVLEIPVALVYNGISHAVMMATPVDLEDFALGFSLSEGLLRDPGELYDLEITPLDRGMEIGLTVSSAAFAALRKRRRTMAGRTGCGLCGAESLEQALPDITPLNSTLSLSPSALRRAASELDNLDTLQRLSGGAHSACWVDTSGTIRLHREDVGRHNALDKLLGALYRRQPPDSSAGFVLVSSRASHEMVQKTAMLGIGLLAAVSAPTSLAVDTARDCGLTLVAHCRGGRYAVYTHESRIAGGEIAE